MKGVLQRVGATSLFFFEVLRTVFCTRGNFKAVLAQVAEISIRALPTVAVAGIFVGAILVIQFNLILLKYDAQIYLGGLNTSSTIREVGPLIISFLLAGKIGAFTTAELGTMRVTEQIDAVDCLGKNSLQYLVVPRFFGIVWATLILLGLGLVIGLGGAMLVADLFCGINFQQYGSSIPRFTGIDTIVSSVFRALVYGTIVASVACYQGYSASGGARGVGRAVNTAAIDTNFYIVIANFVTGALLELGGQLWSS
jgi:phospholipid/cholesterol/gamma-HCH transport system permease protein